MVSSTRESGLGGTYALLDIDNTLIDSQSGQVLNVALLESLRNAGITDVCLFTSMDERQISLDLQAEYLNPRKVYTRQVLIKELETRGFTVHKVITLNDLNFKDNKLPGRYYEDNWLPAYEAAKLAFTQAQSMYETLHEKYMKKYGKEYEKAEEKAKKSGANEYTFDAFLKEKKNIELTTGLSAAYKVLEQMSPDKEKKQAQKELIDECIRLHGTDTSADAGKWLHEHRENKGMMYELTCNCEGHIPKSGGQPATSFVYFDDLTDELGRVLAYQDKLKAPKPLTCIEVSQKRPTDLDLQKEEKVTRKELGGGKFETIKEKRSPKELAENRDKLKQRYQIGLNAHKNNIKAQWHSASPESGKEILDVLEKETGKINKDKVVAPARPRSKLPDIAKASTAAIVAGLPQTAPARPSQPAPDLSTVAPPRENLYFKRKDAISNLAEHADKLGVFKNQTTIQENKSDSRKENETPPQSPRKG